LTPSHPDPYGGRRTACSILHERLALLKSEGAETPIRKAWASALGVNKADLVGVIRGIAETAQISERAKQEVRLALEGILAEQFEVVWQNVSQLIAFENLGAPWRHVSGFLEPPTLDLLKVAHISIRELGAHVIAREDLAAFREQFAQLLVAVDASATLEGDLRKILISLLDQSLRVLDEYEAGGPHATEAAAQRVAGFVVQHSEALNQNAMVPEVSKALSLSARAVAVTAWANQNQGMLTLLLGVGAIVGGIVAPIANPTLTAVGNNIAGLLSAPASGPTAQ
jgi:hypothetical protein